MDDSVGSFPSSSSSSSSFSEHLAPLDRLHVTIPCRTASDALLTSLNVALSEDLTSNVLDAFLKLFQDPIFSSKDVTFRTVESITRHISEQRQRVAQKRSLALSRSEAEGKSSPYGNETRNVYGSVPQLILDLVAQQLLSEMMPMADQVDWDTVICNSTHVQCPRERDLLNMTLVHRTWTGPAVRALRSRVKVMGSKSLHAFMRSPRMGPWLREVYFIESLESENVGEMIHLLTHLLRNTPNLRKLCIRTWWRLGSPRATGLEPVLRELANKRELDELWLFPNHGHGACFPALVEVLPNLRSLKKLHLRNWMSGSADEQNMIAHLHRFTSTSSSSARLTTLSFADGGLNESTSMFLPWLLRDCPLTNLEVHTKDICRLESGVASPLFRALRPFLPKIRILRLHYSTMNDHRDCRNEFLMSCTNLTTLSLIIGLHHELNQFPESIETLHVHFMTIWPVSGSRLHDALSEQDSLTKLHTVKLTKDPLDALVEAGIMVDEHERLEAAWHIDSLKGLCDERNIQLTNTYDFVSFDELSML